MGRWLMHEIITSIEIEASPDVVWTTLTDFAAHPEWNPFIRALEGLPRVGERLRVSIHPPNGKGMTFRPKVLSAIPNQELRWLGHFIVPGVFDGEHYFKIEPLDGGDRTRFTQGERFTGVLVPFLRRSLERGTRQGFEALNRALKTRVEG
jgi:hypothetical protein